MIRQRALVVVLFVGLLGACSDSGSGSSKAGSSGSSGSSAVSDSPAPVPTDGGATPPAGSIDCAAVKDALGGFIVNTQIVIQLPNQSDVANWPTAIGTMSDFGAQLDTLAALEPFDPGVADTLSFFKGANEIAQRGYAGDSAAPGELGTYIGTDVTAVLSKQIPIGMAMDAAGC
jgi:hypothetical protein